MRRHWICSKDESRIFSARWTNRNGCSFVENLTTLIVCTRSPSTSSPRELRLFWQSAWFFLINYLHLKNLRVPYLCCSKLMKIVLLLYYFFEEFGSVKFLQKPRVTAAPHLLASRRGASWDTLPITVSWKRKHNLCRLSKTPNQHWILLFLKMEAVSETGSVLWPKLEEVCVYLHWKSIFIANQK